MATLIANKPRQSWIDLSKFIGILCVIMIHNPLLDSKARLFLQAITISIFFILSGYLYKPVSLKEGIKRDFISLIVPFYIINVMGLVYTCLSSYFQYGIVIGYQEIFPILKDIFLGRNRAMDWGIMGITLSSWFLCSLFVLRVLNYIIDYLKLNKDWMLILITFICFAIAYFAKKTDHELYIFQLNSSLAAVPYFMVGRLFKKYDLYTTIFKMHLVLKLCIVGVLVYIEILLSQYNGLTNIMACEYGQNVFLFYLNDFIGSFAVFLFCSIFYKYHSKYITTTANGMIMILATNIAFVRYFYNISSFFHLPYYYFTPVFVGLLVIALNYPLILLAERYFPLIIGKGFSKKE